MVYKTPAVRGGAVGNASVRSQRCEDSIPATYACSSVVPLVAGGGAAAENIRESVVLLSSLDVITQGLTLVAATWASAWSASYGWVGEPFWTGVDANGDVALTCSSWTSSRACDQGSSGDGTFSQLASSCAATQPMLCACVTTATKAPTATPSASPTVSPTYLYVHVDFSTNINAAYVGEVEVYSVAAPSVNIALGRPVTRTISGVKTQAPMTIVDGNINTQDTWPYTSSGMRRTIDIGLVPSGIKTITVRNARQESSLSDNGQTLCDRYTCQFVLRVASGNSMTEIGFSSVFLTDATFNYTYVVTA